MFPIASREAERMCLCSTFTCWISPLQSGSRGEDRGSRTKCAGKGSGGVDVQAQCVHEEMSHGLLCQWVLLAAKGFLHSVNCVWF